VSNFSKCPACAQVHDVTQPCAADSSLRVLDDVEFCALPDPAWDIPGVTQQSTLEVLFGPSDAGKSTLIAARACCLATGTDWIGMPVSRPGPVVVLVFEGRHAFGKKIRAWKAINDFPASKPIGVYVVEQPVNFLDRVAVFALVNVINARKAHELVIDTLAQSIGAEEENTEMQTAVTNAAMIRRLTGARVVFIHHSGKDRKRGARGGTALTAAADTVLSLDEERDGHVLRCVRQRDGERFAPVFLRLTKTPDGSTVLFERRESAGAPLFGDKAKLHAEILRHLRANPGAITDSIGRTLGKRKADVVTTLAGLLKSGLIAATPKGRGKGWSVVES